jgi:hypothetical protein
VKRIQKFLLFNETKAQMVQNMTNLMSNDKQNNKMNGHKSSKQLNNHNNHNNHEDAQRLLTIKLDKTKRITKLDSPEKGVYFSNASASWIINENEYVTGTVTSSFIP